MAAVCSVVSSNLQKYYSTRQYANLCRVKLLWCYAAKKAHDRKIMYDSNCFIAKCTSFLLFNQ